MSFKHTLKRILGIFRYGFCGVYAKCNVLAINGYSQGLVVAMHSPYAWTQPCLLGMQTGSPAWHLYKTSIWVPSWSEMRTEPIRLFQCFHSSVGNNTMPELSQESMNTFLLITSFKSCEYHIYPQRSWSPKSSTVFSSLLTSASKVANRHKDSYFKNFHSFVHRVQPANYCKH